MGRKSCSTPALKPWLKPILCWYLQGNHHVRVSWVVRDGVRNHPPKPARSPGALRPRLMVASAAVNVASNRRLGIGRSWRSSPRSLALGLGRRKGQCHHLKARKKKTLPHAFPKVSVNGGGKALLASHHRASPNAAATKASEAAAHRPCRRSAWRFRGSHELMPQAEHPKPEDSQRHGHGSKPKSYPQ